MLCLLIFSSFVLFQTHYMDGVGTQEKEEIFCYRQHESNGILFILPIIRSPRTLTAHNLFLFNVYFYPHTHTHTYTAQSHTVISHLRTKLTKLVIFFCAEFRFILHPFCINTCDILFIEQIEQIYQRTRTIKTGFKLTIRNFNRIVNNDPHYMKFLS